MQELAERLTDLGRLVGRCQDAEHAEGHRVNNVVRLRPPRGGGAFYLWSRAGNNRVVS